MPAKTKTTKTTKTAVTRATAKKTAVVRLTNEEKAADTENYILNPVTGNYVKKTSPTGKKLVAGETVVKALTKNEFGIKLVEIIQSIVDVSDAQIKEAIVASEIALPRSFPKKWGGSGRSSTAKDGRPKRALTAYNFFSKEIRPQIKKENPGVPNNAPRGNPDGIQTIMSLIGDAWKALEDKSKYEKLAAEDKKRYESEMAEWGKEHPDDVPASMSPKRPTTTNGYRVYCNTHRAEIKAENPDADGMEINRLISDAWGKLDDDGQQEYKDIAEEENVGIAERQAEFDKKYPVSPKKKSKKAKKLSAAEQAKADNPDEFILNPDSGRYVKRDSKKGKQLAKAEAEAESSEAESTNEEDVTQEIPEDDDDLLIEEED